MTTNRNTKDIEVIINLLELFKKNVEDMTDYQIHVNGIKYLVGQIVRQITIPKDKFFISMKAKEMWNILCDGKDIDIFNFYYQNRVTSYNDSPIEVLTYKGASSTPNRRTINKGDYFHFREVFHDDHIIPMKLILKKLLELDKPDYESIMDILKHVSMCRMLKVEDRRIQEKSRRPFNESEIVEKMYSRYGIFLVDYNYSIINPEFEFEFEDSIQLRIPKEIVKRYEDHPEEYGYKLVVLYNDMVTDVYKDDDGELFSITNNDELINYVVMQQEILGSL